MTDGRLDKDIVVIRHPGTLDKETRNKFKAVFRHKIIDEWGMDAHMLFLEEGMDISIIKKDV